MLEWTPVGNTIRDELEARGWTQRDLAEVMGICPTALNRIVQGRIGVSISVALKLAAALGTSAELWLNLHNTHRLRLIRDRRGR